MASYTFVTSSGPPDSKGKTSNPKAKDVVRSHAMQQVWEQRRSQQAKKRGDGTHFEIVMENDSVSRGKAKTAARRKSLQSETTSADYRRSAAGTKATLRRSATDPESEQHLQPEKVRLALLLRQKRGQNVPLDKIPSKDVVNEEEQEGAQLIAIENDRLLQAVTRLDETTSVGLGTIDPFNACAINIGPKESRYLQHYFTSLSWRFTMPKQTWLRYAVANPGLLHGVLSIAAGHYSFSLNRSLSPDALAYQGKTIEHVRRCIEDPTLRFSDTVIGAIGRMATCNLLFGNRDHYVSHMQGLEWMAQNRGGIENLGMNGQLKYIIACMVTGASPMWWDSVPPSLRYPYGPLDYPAVDDIPMTEPDASKGAAFCELNRIGFLSDEMLDICQAMINLNTMINSTRTWNEVQLLQFGDRWNRLSLRLVYIRERQKTDILGEKNHRRECARLGIQLYGCVFQREAPIRSNIVIALVHRLKTSIYQTDLKQSWEAGLLDMLQVSDWDEVKKIGQGFIWLDFMVEPHAWPIWKEYRMKHSKVEASEGG